MRKEKVKYKHIKDEEKRLKMQLNIKERLQNSSEMSPSVQWDAKKMKEEKEKIEHDLAEVIMKKPSKVKILKDHK